MPTHCTITCFGFHARWIDGVKCGLFSTHAPLGQTTLRVGWWWKEGRRWNPVPAHSLLFSKSTKGATRFNVPIQRTNRYQQYYMPSQHTYCEGVWNLIQDCDVIRKCTSPPLLVQRLKIFKLKFTTPLGIEPRTCRTRGRHATIWASTASCTSSRWLQENSI